MSAFAKLLDEDRRLAFLRFLNEAPACSLNTSVLHSSLCHIGHSCGRDRVNTDAAWLAEQGLIECEEVGPILVCRITGRGSEAAIGLITVPGVKRPAPRS